MHAGVPSPARIHSWRMVIYRAFSHASPDCRQPDGQLALRGFGTASRRVPPLFGTQYDPLCM